MIKKILFLLFVAIFTSGFIFVENANCKVEKPSFIEPREYGDVFIEFVLVGGSGGNVIKKYNSSDDVELLRNDAAGYMNTTAPNVSIHYYGRELLGGTLSQYGLNNGFYTIEAVDHTYDSIIP